MTAPLRRPKAAELVAGELRHQIVSGQLKPGDKLHPENVLQTEFAISRPTLREALRLLESESLITISRGQHGGARVSSIDLGAAARQVGVFLQIEGTTLQDVWLARTVIEPPAARLLAVLRTPAAFAELEANIAAAREAAQRDPLRYAELSAEFSMIIIRHCGNKIFTAQRLRRRGIAMPKSIVVSARTAGAQTEAHGISLFLLDPLLDGVKRDSYPTVDGLRASELTLTNVRVDAGRLLGDEHQGHAVLAATLADGVLAVAAEAVGAMEVLVKDTVSYTRQRQQFGHPLAQFQVLQHRMVDMLVEQELCKSLLYRATMESVQCLPQATRSVHALKHMVGTAGTFVGENAVQLHGGMGMTEELRIGHYFKRLMVINLLFGDADYHLDRFVA